MGLKLKFIFRTWTTAAAASWNPAAVVYTIGAGDSHIGAVMAALSMGNSMREAIETANHAAALVVGVKGAALTREEFSPSFFSSRVAFGSFCGSTGVRNYYEKK